MKGHAATWRGRASQGKCQPVPDTDWPQTRRTGRLLKLLHAHSLSAKVPRTRRWRVTKHGRSHVCYPDNPPSALSRLKSPSHMTTQNDARKMRSCWKERIQRGIAASPLASDQWIPGRSCTVRHPVESQSRRPAAKVARIMAKSGVTENYDGLSSCRSVQNGDCCSLDIHVRVIGRAPPQYRTAAKAS